MGSFSFECEKEGGKEGDFENRTGKYQRTPKGPQVAAKDNQRTPSREGGTTPHATKPNRAIAYP